METATWVQHCRRSVIDLRTMKKLITDIFGFVRTIILGVMGMGSKFQNAQGCEWQKCKRPHCAY
jgi:hypothetical protein